MPSLTYIHQGSQQTPWDMQLSYASNASNWIVYVFTFHLVDKYQRKLQSHNPYKFLIIHIGQLIDNTRTSYSKVLQACHIFFF